MYIEFTDSPMIGCLSVFVFYRHFFHVHVRIDIFRGLEMSF
jgi:hypothetical protein